MPATGRSVQFYADREDLLGWLSELKARYDLNYTLAYWDEGEVVPILADPLQLPDIGIVAPDHSCPSIGYIVTQATDPPRPETIRLVSGGLRFKVSNATNPDSVRISLGGDAGDQTLIASLVDTRAYTPAAESLFQDLRGLVVRLSRRVGRHWVMPGAHDKLTQGWRLTTGKVHAPSADVPRPATARR